MRGAGRTLAAERARPRRTGRALPARRGRHSSLRVHPPRSSMPFPTTAIGAVMNMHTTRRLRTLIVAATVTTATLTLSGCHGLHVAASAHDAYGHGHGYHGRGHGHGHHGGHYARGARHGHHPRGTGHRHRRHRGY